MDTTDKALGRIHWALSAFQTAVPNATVNNFLVFTTVATEPGIKVGDMATRLGFSQPSTPRAVSVLLKRARGKDGLDLIETRPNYMDARIKHLHLTPKGMRLWEQIRRLLK